MLYHLSVQVGDVAAAAQMVGMIVELQVFVGVAFLEVVLRCVGLSHGSFHRAVVTAESFTVHIVVIVRSVVRHPKCSIIFFDCLQLLTIFNIIVHIYRVGPRTPVIRPILSMLVTTVPLPSRCVICVRGRDRWCRIQVVSCQKFYGILEAVF